MRKSLRIASMILVSLLFFSYDSLKAQVKIGGNPAVIDANALLELESNRKGLLLPRLNETGFTAITGVDATVGMVVYYTGVLNQGPGLYVKQTAGIGASHWVKLAGADVADGSWKLGGNTGIDPLNQFLGTVDGQPLVFKTDAVERFKITATGNLIIDEAGIPVDNAENQILLLAADGTVKRKTLSLSMVESLNGKTGALDLEMLVGNGFDEVGLDLATTGKIIMNMPLMTGVATQSYGFMTYADWQKLDHLTNNGIAIGTLVTDESQGANGAKITADGSGGYEIAMGTATENAPGLVGTGAQTFAGDKTFNGVTTFANNVAIDNGTGGDLRVKGKLDIGYTTLYAPAPAPATYNLLVQESAAATEIKRISLPAWKLDGGLASVNGVVGAVADGRLDIEVASAGTDIGVVPDAVANKVTINIPDADPANLRGLMTNGDGGTTQTIAGAKVFNTSLTVGGAAAGASNFNVNGSIGVKHRRIASGSINVDDYVVLVKPTGSATITLPDPADCSGRVYVIKREAMAYPITDADEAVVITVASLGTGNKFYGEATTELSVPNASLNVMSDGSVWQILSRGSGF